MYMETFWYWLLRLSLVVAVVWSRFDAAVISVTIIVGIFTNLGNSSSGISAYSIFNRGCQYLLGDSRAEAVDRELRGHAVVSETQPESPRYLNIPSKFINLPCPCGSGLKAKRCHAMRSVRKPGPSVRAREASGSRDEEFRGFEVVG
jgi:hypothetical protein